ncbi:MAG: ABC transporter ATP-binding protein [Devosia sp.]|uniref:ABC transporter ATP-binding protein n=1 Tax=Devosia sp. TaxID=1871048 RepID=UPI001A5B4B56|nr:ABC transporter ATP-binding protein [Devosia sp.]MBL8599549.1 ABC transporter ATP-binding protein [Devosia sp.]
MSVETTPLISVEGLVTEFRTEGGLVRAVNGIDFTIKRGGTLAVLGESGCGKSVTGLSLLNLIRPPGAIAGGRITYYGMEGGKPVELTSLPPTSEAMRKLRGSEIGMIFQEPMTSFDPLYTVGEQIIETLMAHKRGLGRAEARVQAVEMLAKVRLPSPEILVDRYPHQLSGGMRQRVMIAMALSCGPKLLIADEPTTALDVTTESQILDLLQNLQQELGMAVMFITHDLAVASEMADEVVVMYLGYVVERGPVEDVLNNPSHPYTQALLESVPRLDADSKERLRTIEGMVPTPDQMPRGCPFHTRCRHFMPGICDTALPPLYAAGPDHEARCVLVAPDFAKEPA